MVFGGCFDLVLENTKCPHNSGCLDLFWGHMSFIIEYAYIASLHYFKVHIIIFTLDVDVFLLIKKLP